MNNVFWSEEEKRLGAGWRILVQILLTAVPLSVLGLSGFYSAGNQNLRVALTAGPITVISVLLCSRLIDKRKISDLGIHLSEKAWWSDLGFGILAGFLSASAYVLLLKVCGWGEVILSKQWKGKGISFAGSILLGIILYLIVGIFEELMRTYQIRNAIEGLAGTKIPLSGAVLLAVFLGAAWSFIGHVSSGNPSFLVYVLVWAVIYGVFFLWTGRVALAMAIHFGCDFTLSSIFQLGSTSEGSLYYVQISRMPDFPFEMSSLLGITAKVIGFLLVLWWVRYREGKIRVKEELVSPTLIKIT